MNCANHPDRERVAFCQNCGKPLCEECKRVDGNSIFCEPCFAMRGAQAPPPGYSSGYSSGPYAPPAGGYVPGGPLPRRAAEPVLAGLLGLIPGVGAMYNEQFAKGIVHLVVFAILVSLANDVNGIFGIFIAGWVLYMAFDAYHTARARRDGTPLPNPFGLNDLGERMGFGKGWPGPHPPYNGSSVPPYDPAAQGPAQGPVPPQTGAVPQTPPAGQAWAAPGSYYHRGADGSETYSTPTAFFHRGASGSETYGVPPASNWGAPYDVPPVPQVPVPPIPSHRHIPTGAVWLIAIGIFFLVGHAPVFRVFHGRLFGPLVLIAIGIWIFVRRMLETGHSLENDGSDFYRWRLTHAINRAAWLVLVGALWLLDALHVFSWSHSWPVLLIVGGVLMIFRRTMFSPGYGAVPPYGAAPTAPVSSAAPVTSTEIVPADPAHFTRDDHEEGR